MDQPAQRGSDGEAEHARKNEGPAPGFTPKQDTTIARHLDKGVFSAGEFAVMVNTSRATVHRAAARPATHRTRGAGARGGLERPQIFITDGALLTAAPHTSSSDVL